MIAVDDAVSAVTIASEENPDVVLVDLKMPEKTGFQLADELRHLPGLSNIPIIAMTGFFRDNYASLMSICGIRKCLKKPFNPLDVISEIEDALKEK